MRAVLVFRNGILVYLKCDFGQTLTLQPHFCPEVCSGRFCRFGPSHAAPGGASARRTAPVRLQRLLCSEAVPLYSCPVFGGVGVCISDPARVAGFCNHL